MTTVIHIVISLDPGGLERLVVDWTKGRQSSRGATSTGVTCIDRRGALASALPAESVVCLRTGRPSRSDLTGWFALAAVVRKSQATGGPVIMHCHNLRAWQYGVLAGILTGARVIYTQHGANVHNFGLLNRWRCRFLSRFTSKIVTVSEATRDAMVEEYGLARDRISVIANGVDVAAGASVVARVSRASDMLDPAETAGTTTEVTELQSDRVTGLQGDRRALRRRLGLPDNAIIIGSVGRLSSVKGYDRLLRAIARSNRCDKVTELQSDRETGSQSDRVAEVDAHGGKAEETRMAHPQTQQVHLHKPPSSPCHPVTLSPCHSSPTLLLVGDGPERAALEGLANELGLKERVIFAGYQVDPAPFLKGMDLFVLSSRSEGMSVALLEAMAVCVPVLVTDVGGNREIIDDGRAGALLPDDEALWPAVISAELRRDKASSVSHARQRVEALYSMEATLKAYEELYGETVL